VTEYKPDEIYNLAGQSSVDYSFNEPASTINYNVISVLNLLEIIRLSNKRIKFYQATSCEMYSDVDQLPITEKTIIHPSSPYGVSKAAAHMLVVNYRESFDIFCVSGILFNHESHLRNSNYFIRRLIRTAIDISNGEDKYVNLGQADNKRDFGYSADYVEAMWLMLQNDKPKDYLICSGKSVAIREIVDYVFKKFNISSDRIKIDPKLFRKPNIKNLFGDNSKAKKEMGWGYNKDFFEVLDILIEEELQDCK